MYGLHLSLDLIMHEYERESGLYKEWLWLEVLMWIVNIVLIYAFVRVWKKNRQT